MLNRLSSELGSSLDEDTILRLTCQHLLSALSASRVAVVLSNEAGELVVPVEVPAGPEALPLQPAREMRCLTACEKRREYFPASDVGSEPELRSLNRIYFSPRNVQSATIIPLVTAVRLQGWLIVQTSTPYRFTSSEIELARTMSNQASIALQNARLYNETRRLTQDLERRVEERTSDVRREHNNTQALLRIITELSTSLDLNTVMNRTLMVLNETIGAEESLIAYE